MVIEVGKLAGSAIVPYSQSTKRTKVIDLVKTTDITATGTSLGTYLVNNAKATFYSDSNNNWYVEASGELTCDSVARLGIDITFVNMSFEGNPGSSQIPVLTNLYDAGYFLPTASGVGPGSVLAIKHISRVSRIYTWNFRAALTSEPTTYTTTANMEASVQADIYVEPASVGKSGLVDNSAGNVTGTPIKGKTDGVAVSAGYVGQKVDASLGNTTVTYDTYTEVGSLSIPTGGVWMIYGAISIPTVGYTTVNTITLNISDTAASGTGTLEYSKVTYPADGTQSSLNLPANPLYIVLDASDTWYLNMYVDAASGASNTVASASKFYAVRIA